MFSSKDLFFAPTATTGYRIEKSLRFRSSASAYLSRTFSTPTNASKWTKSFWIKRGALGTVPILAAQTVNASANYAIQFNSDNTITWQFSNTLSMVTTQVFRDPSAWYHFVLVWDVGNATAANRAIIYVNGVQINNFTTDNRSSLTTTQNAWGTAGSATISYTNGTNSLDGYMADINFIDGQALTPSSFGETDATTGVWKPKAYTGTYGTNGFYLKFADNSGATATTIGKDSSGNGNNWTPNNISVTAGTTYDSMIDTPTPYDDGGNGVGNYATFNPLVTPTSTTLSNGNLTFTKTATIDMQAVGTQTLEFGGKYYWEITIGTLNSSSNFWAGVVYASTVTGAWVSSLTNGAGWNGGGTGTRYGTTVSAGTANYAAGQIVAFAYDQAAGTLALYINNSLIGTITGLSTTARHVPFVDSYANGESGSINFGQRPFTYTPPSGFKALNTQNLPTPTIAAGNTAMAVSTYNGTSASNTISNGVFQPDLVWIKSRSAATNHEITDAVRGTTKSLVSNSTAAEATDTNGLTAFTSTGFTVGSDSNYNNGTGPATYVAWQWKGANGTVSNTSGSITSTVSANTTAGFSVVTYTGTGTNATVGHGLGVAPNMIIVKARNASGQSWVVYNSNFATPGTGYLYLDSTQAVTTAATLWNSTAATSTVFSVGTNAQTNGNGTTYVAYCFAVVAGYSAFGSYTGNGSADGPFVFTGFRPRWLMIKRTDSTGFWYMTDSARDTYNPESLWLVANGSNAETSFTQEDFLSNGFKLRNTNADWNASGGTYIYAAFAENPFKYALAR